LTGAIGSQPRGFRPRVPIASSTATGGGLFRGETACLSPTAIGG